MGKKKNLLALAAYGLLSGQAWSFDLSQAYSEALEQDSTIRGVRAATDARRERLPQARALLLPNLSASISRYRNSLERTSPDSSGQPVTSDLRYTSRSEVLSLRQPIFRLVQMADYRQAAAQVEDAEAVLERETQNVGVRVSGAYFEALLAEEHLALVLAQKTAYTTQFDAAQKRLGAGFGMRTDVDEARAALDLNVAQELEARQSLDFTRRQLQSLVNRPIDRLAPLDPSRMQLARPVPDRLEDWVERAEANSPELQSLAAQVEAAKYELEKAQAGHYPTLDAVVQLSRSDSDTVTSVKTRYTNRSIGLQLSIPLYSGGYVSSTVRQALAGQERAQEALEATRRDLGVRLHREFRGVTEGVLRVRALEQAVRSAEQVVISNSRSFDAGSRTLPDVLNAEQQKVSAQRDLAQARFIYLMSRIRLQALAGGARAEVIDEVNGWLVR
ncbi:TolC family outer membrane protein [Variovorax sp. CCNWLW235]|uniref:TolC family outer membrane protein n=1 Tax=Variovorax sp. CCNWLW235 TaxID=3127463 RepID=UPI003076D382